MNVIVGLRLALRECTAEATVTAIADSARTLAVIGKMCFIVITPIFFDFVRLAVNSRAVSARAEDHHNFPQP